MALSSLLLRRTICISLFLLLSPFPFLHHQPLCPQPVLITAVVSSICSEMCMQSLLNGYGGAFVYWKTECKCFSQLLKECRQYTQCTIVANSWLWPGRNQVFDHTVSYFCHGQRNPCLLLKGKCLRLEQEITWTSLSVIYSRGRTLYNTTSLEVKDLVLCIPPSYRPAAQKPSVRVTEVDLQVDFIFHWQQRKLHAVSSSPPFRAICKC